MDYSDFVSSTLQAASEIAQEKYGHVTGSTKSDDNNQVLTEADIAIGKLILSKIQSQFPEHNIIDEEAGVIDNQSEFTWVVDPIDGTSNFANGIPTYGIMFGMLHQDQPIAGGIALPYFNEIIVAEKGKGAFANGEKIQVTKEENLMKCLVSYGIDGQQEDPQKTFEELKTLGKIVLNIRNLRSSNSVYDIVLVAEGKYGAMLNRSTKIWDNVAPQIVIEEAGGVYTDFWGKLMDYSNHLNRAQENFTCSMAAPALHKKIQQIIS